MQEEIIYCSSDDEGASPPMKRPCSGQLNDSQPLVPHQTSSPSFVSRENTLPTLSSAPSSSCSRSQKVPASGTNDDEKDSVYK